VRARLEAELVQMRGEVGLALALCLVQENGWISEKHFNDVTERFMNHLANIKLVSHPAVSFGISSSLKEPATVPASSGHVEPVDKGKQPKNVKARDQRHRERHHQEIDEQEAEHALSLNNYHKEGTRGC